MPLRGKSEFRRVYREGRRRQSGGVTVIRASFDPGPPRVGIVAGKRVGSAVDRNRAKRRLRAALRSLPLWEDTAYIVVASPRVNTARFAELTGWLRAAVEENE